MPANAESKFRQYVGRNFSSLEDVPEDLRQYFQYQAPSSEGGGEGYYWLDIGAIKDSEGRPVVLVDDDGGLHEDLDWNEGVDRSTAVRFDPNWGLVTDPGNVNQEAFERRSRRNQMAALAIIGGAGIAGAAMGAGAAGAGAAEAAGGAGAAGGSSAAAGGAGTAIAAPGTLGSGTTLVGTGLSGGAGAVGTGSSLVGTGLTTGTGATLAGTAGGSSALIGGAGAGVAGAASGAGAGAAAGGGEAAGLVANNSSVLGSVGDWYNGLSPISQRVISGALSTGASALLQGMNQREQQQFIEQQEEQRRQDRIRRGQIPAFGSAFTQRPGQVTAVQQLGLIGSRRGG